MNFFPALLNANPLSRLGWAGLCAVGLLTGCGPSERELELEAREQALIEVQAELSQQRELLDARLRQVAVQEDVLESTHAALEEQRLEFERKAADAEAREHELRARQNQVEEEMAAVTRLRDHWEAKVARGLAPEIEAGRAIVIDAQTGEVLFEKNADKPGPVASLQKVLTGLIVAEAGDLEEPVIIAESDTDAEPVVFGVKAGEAFTKRQLLAILFLRSSNDVALALARIHSGSVPVFMLRMNQRAQELGMDNSLFANPHGLPAPEDEQFSTARDLARLAMVVDRQPDLRELMERETFPLTRPDGNIVELENLNGLLRYLDECDGMKTGFTRASGHCLMLSGERDGLRRIVIVLNSDQERVADEAAALLKWSLRG